MSTTSKSFFSTQVNQAILRRFELALESFPNSATLKPNIIPSLKLFFGILISNAEAFDQHCSANIQWIGNNFINELTNFSEIKLESKNELLISIFTSSYRFICELEFSQPDDLSFELRSIKKFVDDNLESFAVGHRSQLVYANYIMPSSVVKKLINSPALSEFKAFAETATAAKEMKEKWDKELEDKNIEIEALRSGLGRITTTYNFVGLVKGFESLGAMKKGERTRSFAALLGLGFLMVAPVLTELWFIATNIDAIDTHKNTLVYSLPPLIALEVILLYFFRVVLYNFRSNTTQLLQINLRISLCQFIQSYSEYSTKIKKQDSGALDKFESLIFSGITSDAELLPSTFDGVEQIAKLVNSIRNK